MRNVKVVVFILIAFLISSNNYAQNQNQNKQEKGKYLVEFKHTKEECLNDLDKINEKNAKLLSKIDWACMSGDHTGYMITEANNEKDALKGIPEDVGAKAIKVTKFTPKQIEEFHKK